MLGMKIETLIVLPHFVVDHTEPIESNRSANGVIQHASTKKEPLEILSRLLEVPLLLVHNSQREMTYAPLFGYHRP